MFCECESVDVDDDLRVSTSGPVNVWLLPSVGLQVLLVGHSEFTDQVTPEPRTRIIMTISSCDVSSETLMMTSHLAVSEPCGYSKREQAHGRVTVMSSR